MKRCIRGLVAFALVLALICPMFSLAASAKDDVEIESASFSFSGVGTVTFDAKLRVFDTAWGADRLDYLTPGNNKFDVSASICYDYEGYEIPTETYVSITMPKSTVLTFNCVADYPDLFVVYDAEDKEIKPDGTTYTVTADGAYMVLTSPKFEDPENEYWLSNNISVSNISLVALGGGVTVAYDSIYNIYVGDSSTPITQDTAFNNVSTTAGIKLKASIKTDDPNINTASYQFAGWYLEDKGEDTVYLSDKPEFTFIPETDDPVIHVKYISTSTNVDRNAFIAGNEDVGYRIFTSGTSASAITSFVAALDYCEEKNDVTNDMLYVVPLKKAITIGSRTDPYVIPSNTTLLVPYDDMHSAYTEENILIKSGAHPLTTRNMNYCKLSFNRYVQIEVEDGGAICVCAVPAAVDTSNSYVLNSKTGQYEYSTTTKDDVQYIHNGPVYDYYGELALASNATITLKGGSNLYAWGFVTGSSGHIVCEKGSTLFEYFQIADFRGGTITQAMMSSNQFPFNQYYVQNIECLITFEYGSVEKVLMAAYVLAAPYKFVTEFIGYEDPENGIDCGFFKLKRNYESDDPKDQGSLERHYDKQHDKVYYNIKGNTAIASIKIKLDDPRGGYIDVDSKDYYMPITNINVTLESGANLFAESNYIFLPGSSLVIDDGATMHIKEESDIVFADKDDVLTYSANGGTKNITPFKPCVYFPGANLERTWENTADAELNNNGNIEVDNKSSLRTTSGGANIYSSENTGSFTMGRTNNAKLDVYQNGESTSQISINRTAFNVTDDEGNVIDTIDISGTWFGVMTDDIDAEITEEEADQFSQFEDRCVYSYSDQYQCWGNFCDVTYYSSAESDAETLYSYDSMNIVDKLDNQLICSGDDRLEKEYTLDDDNGVRAVNNVFDDGWVYVPTYDAVAGEYLYTQVRAYPRYSRSIATHTVTWYDEDGTTVLGTDSVMYGESPEMFTPAVTEKTVGGKIYTLAGWIAETFDAQGDRTFENGVFYARGDELPKIGAVANLNDPCYKAVFKQCFEKHSLTLAGDISTNFYVNVPSAYSNMIDKLRVDFSWGKQYSGDVEGVYQYKNRAMTASDTLTASTNGLYKATVNIAAKEMNDTITARLIYTPTNREIASESYSAAEYLYNALNYERGALAMKIKGSNDSMTEDQALAKADALKDLCKATLAYGASAQIDFNYKTNELVDYGLDADTEGHNADAIVGADSQAEIMDRFFDITDPDSATSYESILWDIDFTGYDIRSYKEIFPNGVGSGGYYGSSLTLNADVNYNLYFRHKLILEEWEGVNLPDVEFTVTAYTVVDGVLGAEHPVSRTIVPADEYNFIRFDIENIAAADITKDIRVTFTRTDGSVPSITFDVNPGTYFYNVLALENDNDETNNLKNVVCNLYNYNQKAIAYYG